MEIEKLENGEGVIDVRELVNSGQHPKDDILNYLDGVPAGTVTKIHVPHQAEPLVRFMEKAGVAVETEKLGEDHFCLHTIKK